MRTLKLHANKRIKKYLHFAPFQYLRSFHIYISTYFLCCWHKLIIEDRSGSTAELSSLLIAKINELWNGLVRSLPNFVIFFFFLPLEINFILIWNYVSLTLFSITAIYLYSVFFLVRFGRSSKRQKKRRSQYHNEIKFFLLLSLCFYCFCLGRAEDKTSHEPKKWSHLVTEYIGIER